MSEKEENSFIPPVGKLNWNARVDGVKRGEMEREPYEYTDNEIISLSDEQQRRLDILQMMNSQVKIFGMEQVKTGEGKTQKVLRELKESGMKREDFILILE